VTKRDASDKEFDPSSFDDVLELVGAWTAQGTMTAPQIVERLRALGVAVRATSSGRHVIVESQRRHLGEPAEAKLFVMPLAERRPSNQLLPAAPARVPRVVRPPGQTLHRIAALFSKRTRERILDPIIADMQAEYCDVLAAEHPRWPKLWLVQVRAWVAFAEAIFLRTVVGRMIRGVGRLLKLTRLV